MKFVVFLECDLETPALKTRPDAGITHIQQTDVVAGRPPAGRSAIQQQSYFLLAKRQGSSFKANVDGPAGSTDRHRRTRGKHTLLNHRNEEKNGTGWLKNVVRVRTLFGGGSQNLTDFDEDTGFVHHLTNFLDFGIVQQNIVISHWRI